MAVELTQPTAMFWMFASSQNSYFEISTPKDDGIRRQGLWEVLKS